jgi:hypothetical protein
MVRMAIYSGICTGGCLSCPPAKMVSISAGDLLKWSTSTNASVLAVRKLPATCAIVLAVAKTNRQHRIWEVPAQTVSVLVYVLGTTAISPSSCPLPHVPRVNA